MRGFTKQTGLKRQPEREQVIKAVPLDQDILKAQSKTLFSPRSAGAETISSKTIDLSSRYGNNQLKAPSVEYHKREKIHLLRDHPGQVDWFEQNQDMVLKAINDPLFMDIEPRQQGKFGWNVAHIIYTGDKEYPYLNVVVSFHNGKANIWTMFKAPNEFVFEKDGNLKRRWVKIK